MSKTMMIAVAVVAFVIMVVALIYLLKTSQDVKAARATNRYAGVDGGRSHAGKYARLVLLR